MRSALLVLAAGEPSKLPFYLIGGCLAGWAVVLAYIGLSRPGFPGSLVRARGVMLVSFVLVAGTIGSAIATASKPKRERETAAPAGGAVKVAADPGGQLKYDTKSLQAKAGQVTIDFTNQSPISHNVTVESGGKKLGATKTISGSTTTAKLDLKPGDLVRIKSKDEIVATLDHTNRNRGLSSTSR
jgi:plastocyanin